MPKSHLSLPFQCCRLFFGKYFWDEPFTHKATLKEGKGEEKQAIRVQCLIQLSRQFCLRLKLYVLLLMSPLDTYPQVNKAIIHKTLHSLGNIVDDLTLPLVVLYELHTVHITPPPETRNARIEVTTISSSDKKKQGNPKAS